MYVALHTQYTVCFITYCTYSICDSCKHVSYCTFYGYFENQETGLHCCVQLKYICDQGSERKKFLYLHSRMAPSSNGIEKRRLVDDMYDFSVGIELSKLTKAFCLDMSLQRSCEHLQNKAYVIGNMLTAKETNTM